MCTHASCSLPTHAKPRNIPWQRPGHAHARKPQITRELQQGGLLEAWKGVPETTAPRNAPIPNIGPEIDLTPPQKTSLVVKATQCSTEVTQDSSHLIQTTKLDACFGRNVHVTSNDNSSRSCFKPRQTLQEPDFFGRTSGNQETMPILKLSAPGRVCDIDVMLWGTTVL